MARKRPKQASLNNPPAVRPGRPNLDEFFAEYAAVFAELGSGSQRLVSIPVWGAQGDGKSTSILTAAHYLRVKEHGVQLDTITYESDLDVLHKLGYSLGPMARASKEALDDLRRRFVEERKWIPGTDRPVSYLLKLVSVRGMKGVVYLPDLPGGHYEEGQGDAEGVLAEAHSIIVLVDPAKYQGGGVQGRTYQGEILGRLQAGTAQGLPIAVLVTKVDSLNKMAEEAADQTLTELTVALESMHANYELFRVSVFGTVEAKQFSNEELPPERARNPDQLLRAWRWAIMRACEQAFVHVNPSPITLKVESFALRGNVAGAAILEIRADREYSGVQGYAIASLDAGRDDGYIICLSDNGEIKRISLPEGGGTPFVEDFGGLADSPAQNTGDYKFLVSGGTAVAGLRFGADLLFLGELGGELRKTELPAKAASWSLAASNRIVLLTDEGRLFSLFWENSKWEVADHMAVFDSCADNAFCNYLPDEQVVLASDGVTTKAIRLNTLGKFAESREPILKLQFAGKAGHMNGKWFCAPTAKGSLAVAFIGGTAQHGSLLREPKAVFAAAFFNPIFAYVGSENSLYVIKAGEKIREASIPLNGVQPLSLHWLRQDRVLVASLPEGKIATFRVLGS